MIKLVAIDLDGTMYNSKKVITTEVRHAIVAAHDAGIETAIITGRGQQGAELAIDHLGIDVPYISSAGAMIRSGKHGSVLGAWPFHVLSQTAKLIDFALNNDIAMLGEQLDGRMIWCGSDARYDLLDKKTKDEVALGIISTDPHKDFDQDLLKITFGTESKLLEAAEFIARECPALFPVISSTMYIDITKDHVNKGFGLAEFAKIRGYQVQEVAAIGDQEIDLHALHFAGLPIAMENGVQKLKDHAEWIAPSNDDHGVAWALNEIINRNQTDHAK